MAGWYRQGTVTLTQGSAAVTGSGTLWLGAVRDGSTFTTDYKTLYEVVSVSGDGSLTLDRPWEGASVSAGSYAVIFASETISNAELVAEIATMVAKWAQREDQYDDWIGGDPHGGPNGDGRYPLTDSKGVTRLVESPALLLQLLDDGTADNAARIIAAIEDDVATARQAATDAAAAIAVVQTDRQAVSAAAATVATNLNVTTEAAQTATSQANIATLRANDASASAQAAEDAKTSVDATWVSIQAARDTTLAAKETAVSSADTATSARNVSVAARDTAVGAKDTAVSAKTDSEAARDLAKAWATKTDGPVSGTLKSALAYALDASSQATTATNKAAEAAASAAAAQQSASDLAAAVTSAQSSANSASASAQTATDKAGAASQLADAAGTSAATATSAASAAGAAQAASEAARDTAVAQAGIATAAASQAADSQTNAANSAQTAAAAAADAISAKSDATNARDLAVSAKDSAVSARDLAQAFANAGAGYQVTPGTYSAYHWSEQARAYAQQTANIVGGTNFGIIGDGTTARFTASGPGAILNLVQGAGAKLTYNPSAWSVSFGFDSTTAPITAISGMAATTVQGAVAELKSRIDSASSIGKAGGLVSVDDDGDVVLAPAAGKVAFYNGSEIHTVASAYSKAQTDAAIAAGTAAKAVRFANAMTLSLTGGVTGSIIFDGASPSVSMGTTVASVPASAITGTISLSNLPAGALERLVVVANQAARYALTTATVQLGDTVKESDTGRMFYLKNEASIGSAAGWEEYSVGSAASVPWTGITGRPTTLSGFGITDGQPLNPLLTAISALDASNGVLVQTGSGAAAKRAIGVATATDIPDRAAADGRYAQLGANNTLTGTLRIQNSSWEAIHVENAGGTKYAFLGWNDTNGYGRLGAYGASAWQNFAISEGGSLTAIGTTTMPTGGAKLNVATGIQIDNNNVWHAGNFTPSSKLDAANPVMQGALSRTGGTAPAYYMSQDGMGRQHWYWNTAGGTAPTFSVAGEDAMDIGMSVSNDGVNGPQFWFRGAHGNGKAAGASFTWSNILYASMTTFQWMGNTVWHAGNFNPASYAPLGAANSFTGKQKITGSGTTLPAATGIAAQSSDTGGLEIWSQGTGTTAGAAFMSFHRPGSYAIHLGLDTDNRLKVGGWSMGANAHEIWHAGNAPISTGATASTVVMRGTDGLIASTGLVASDGQILQLGGGQTAQYPQQVQIAESTHATSRRSGIGIGGWILASDTAGSGTRDFGVWSMALSAWVMRVITIGAVIFYKAVRGAAVTLTDAATITPDFAAGNYFKVTLAGNRVMSFPANVGDCQGGSIWIIQDSTGSRTLSFAAGWKFDGGAAPSLSTTPGAIDRLDYVVRDSGAIEAVLHKDVK
ncbi:hypothetical protein [Azospirillum sp. Sh1]|uniref:hypothetical protein n=1 Tax=Azospirillum sp. Sh1 TaxID=2607285 RepID=UPI0011EBE43D|nr:hypothetical protein [Azospirillum sp. Sh1]KAA0573371.1 hypothetical protein FZ029_20545 [Azospirillum sp. Sh1]